MNVALSGRTITNPGALVTAEKVWNYNIDHDNTWSRPIERQLEWIGRGYKIASVVVGIVRDGSVMEFHFFLACLARAAARMLLVSGIDPHRFIDRLQHELHIQAPNVPVKPVDHALELAQLV